MVGPADGGSGAGGYASRAVGRRLVGGFLSYKRGPTFVCSLRLPCPYHCSVPTDASLWMLPMGLTRTRPRRPTHP